MNLEDIQSPADLKNLNTVQLGELARQIRHFLIQSISQTGGHLSSNLGAVELTLAIHKVFDSPKDKIIFDVGHQSYVHKILTGRMKDFPTLRQYGGMSGFQKRSESEHDFWEAGHSSTSISAGLGIAAARDLQHQDYEVVSVIGDGAIGSGMALEALNDLGAQKRKMIVIFNDNAMSISQNRTGLERTLTKLRTSDLYRHTKKDVADSLSGSAFGRTLLGMMKSGRDAIKHNLIDAPLFSQFDLDYLGPVDGHNLDDLISALQTAKEHDGPIVVHVLTQKGKGYLPAQQDISGKWHGVGPFEPSTGQFLKKKDPARQNWSYIISSTLCRLAANNDKICAITPAMEEGSELTNFARMWPERFFDPGIAEEHAMTMAAGMAQGGLRPFLSIYSSFLQRAYDQLIHDVARMNLPVVIGIDRAGLVGADGETHQGIYDIAFLRTIPNLIIAQPKDSLEAQNLLYSAFKQNKPFALRYPRGDAPYLFEKDLHVIETGTWEKTDVGEPESIVITYGPDVDAVIERAKETKTGMTVVNARFLNPIDTNMLDELLETGLPISVYETDQKQGGLGDAVLEYINDKNRDVRILGIEKGFVQHGAVDLLKKEQKITLDDLFEGLPHAA